MATLYLIEQNTILRKTSDRLRLCRMRTPQQRRSHVTQGEILLELPCEDVDHIMVFGNVQITTQALQKLLLRGIELAIFTFSGKLLGQLTPPETKNIYLRVAQFEKYHDQQFCLEMSKNFVSQKIKCMQEILKRYEYSSPNTFSSDELNKFDLFLSQAYQSEQIDSLRGFEGSATALYFQLFGRMLKSPWKFNARSRRPPKDPVNAVLSFGYVIVGAELQSLLDGVGFDPFLGFYHTIEYGRPSLALDLLEEYRHSLIDRLALRLFNLDILKENDFYKVPNEGIYLNTSGKTKFFTQYERMVGEFGAATDGAAKRKGFRTVFQTRIMALANQIRES
ncbi:CRISPR-associated endonuclease Cas1 [candidate division KSB1 bacterium]|nr:CRISPR-associated endonuclease Cas1 [candidate division KSB1 bacterium]